MRFIKSLIPYVLFATMIYLGTRIAFSVWTEEGNGSVTWVEEDGGTKQTYKLFDYHVIFSSSIQLPTALGSITGAGPGTGFDADKLDGQDGSYYLNASSGGILTPLAVFNSSMTEVERRDNSKLNASSGTTTALLIADRLINSSGTILAELIPTRLNASSGTVVAVLMQDMNTTSASTWTVIMSSFGALDTRDAAITADLLASSTTLDSKIDGLIGTSVRHYFNGTFSDASFGYYGSSLTVDSTERTITKALSGLNVLISSTVVALNSETIIPGGRWEIEFYGQISQNNQTTRVWYEIYDGTGTSDENMATRFIGGTSKSRPLLNGVKQEFFVSMTTDTYTPKSRYLTIVCKADEVGTNPTLSLYCGGASDSHLELPSLLVDVSVTKITAGVGNSISPTSGVGNVTINVAPSTACAKVDEIAQNWFTTSTVYSIFSSTDLVGDMCVSTQIIVVNNNDLIITGWNITNSESGSCSLILSSAAFGMPFGVIDGGVSADNTKRMNSVSQTDSSGTVAGFTATSIGVGGKIKLVLVSAVGQRNISWSLKTKKWAK